MTRTEADVYYDMYDRDIYASPYETFRRLRNEAPLYYNEKYNFYALSRHDDLARVLPDRDTYISGKGMVYNIITPGRRDASGPLHQRGPSDAHDAPGHRVAAVHPASRRRPRAADPRAVPRRSSTASSGRDHFDFMRDFALQLPVQVIGMLVGVPKKDQADLLAVFQKNLHEGSADPDQKAAPGHPRIGGVVQRVPRLAREEPVGRRHDPADAVRVRGRDRSKADACGATRSSPTSR